VLSVDLPKDPRTGTNRGYAFVEMGSSSEAADAVTNLNGHDVSGRRLNLTLAETTRTEAEERPQMVPIRGKMNPSLVHIS
jgi:RNA recognition motif-containing protein